MKESMYQNYEELPLFLNSETVANAEESQRDCRRLHGSHDGEVSVWLGNERKGRAPSA